MKNNTSKQNSEGKAKAKPEVIKLGPGRRLFSRLLCSLGHELSAGIRNWPHLRTTNPIESTFATVRLRTHRTKGSSSRIATLTMVFKLGLEAQKHWRRLNGAELVAKVVTGVKFVDGEEQTQQAA